MHPIAQKHINAKQDELKNQNAKIEKLNALIDALETHTGKLIDKRFFESHFTVQGEYRTYTTLTLSQPRYSFQNHAHDIYLVPNESLELGSRETAHVLERAKEERTRTEQYIERLTKAIADIQNTDVDTIIADIVAVYEKHNKPEALWHDILDAYEIKWPPKTKK